MCGIVGIMAFTEEGKKYLDKIDDAVKSLHHRGPDGHGVFRHGNVALGHTRLAIIDTSDAAAQPFTSSDGRYTIVFNGEIFNYKELRAELEKEGYTFRTQSDTEVLLTYYRWKGIKCFDEFNGYFAIAIYDHNNNTLLLARDRFGEKPLYVTRNENFLAFGSEVKCLLPFISDLKIQESSLVSFLHLNYIPLPNSIYQQVWELDPGGYRHIISKNESRLYFDDREEGLWYKFPVYNKLSSNRDEYKFAVSKVRELVSDAVQRRLISDVPLGSFLSGGVDSSIVSALAAREKPSIETFSIGYKDEPFFDETEYANLVAKHVGSKHHVISVGNRDLLESLHQFIANLDEPFADSSALALNILARETRKHVTVALSGDGADELFAGYNKHAAEFLARNPGMREKFIRAGKFVWTSLPSSRNNSIGNTIRKLQKFSKGMAMKQPERYWLWAGFTEDGDIDRLLTRQHIKPGKFDEFSHLAESYEARELNGVLRADFKLVLEGDMLVKVDRMSMLNSLEVRSPFLDHELVEYVMSLPSEYKINRHERKRILKDAFRDMLPPEIFARRKQGFEVPLLKWFRGDLRGMIDELLNEKFLKEQRLFNPEEVKNIRKQLHSNDPGDSAARIWGLIVFQSWWKKYLA